MFTKTKEVIQGKNKLENFIPPNFDAYNSLFLYKLRDPSVPRVAYVINTDQQRPDLIAKDFYGSEDYMGIVMIQTSNFTGLDYYKKGRVIPLIEKAHIDNLLNMF